MYLSELLGRPGSRVLQGISVPEETDNSIPSFSEAVFTDNLQRRICPNTTGLQQKRVVGGFFFFVVCFF